MKRSIFQFACGGLVLMALVASHQLAHSQDAPAPAAPVFTFTKEQTETIAQMVVQKRNEAAAEYTKWNDLLMEIQKQAGLLQKKVDDAKAAEPKP